MTGSSYEWAVEVALAAVWGQRSFLRLRRGEASERSGQDNSLLSERECLHMAKPVGWQWHVLTNRSALPFCAANGSAAWPGSGVLPAAQRTFI